MNINPNGAVELDDDEIAAVVAVLQAEAVARTFTWEDVPMLCEHQADELGDLIDNYPEQVKQAFRTKGIDIDTIMAAVR